MIAIVDYGVGNLFSLLSSLRALDLEAEVTGDAGRLRAADRIILPGVGAFGDARAKLDATGLVPVIQEEAEKKPARRRAAKPKAEEGEAEKKPARRTRAKKEEPKA